ncbi:hypothetical protein MRX96_020471 [Rhipicephalus microplus]
MLSGSGSGKRAFSSGELPTSSGGQFTRTDSTSTAKTSAEEPRHPHSYFGSDDAANCKRGPPRRTSKASKGGSVSDSSRSSARYKKGRKQKLSPPHGGSHVLVRGKPEEKATGQEIATHSGDIYVSGRRKQHMKGRVAVVDLGACRDRPCWHANLLQTEGPRKVMC